MGAPDLLTLIAQLQRRIGRLLLRHDRRAFRGRFREFYARSKLPLPPILREYDRYARLIILANELFDDLLPRIRRQMSFHASQLRLDEEPPLRGQIDWNRSLQRTWSEQPDQPPIRFMTTLRSRSFATPENQFAVAALQRYIQVLDRLRAANDLEDAPLNTSEEQELILLADRARRELATAHFQELSRDSDPAQISDLAAQVGQRVRGASPYAELIAWWHKLEQLHVRVRAPGAAAPTLGTQEHAGLLYQLWIALELVDFLHEGGHLAKEAIAADRLTLDFSWAGRAFQLVYDRQPTSDLAWRGAPGERPDYYITRAAPDRLRVTAPDGALIWQEPGVLLDAKCYAGQHASRASEPIKRLLADLQLVDAANGMLIFPDASGLPAYLHPLASPAEPIETRRYPGTVEPAAEIRLVELRPMLPRDTLQAALQHILDQAAAWLPERPPVTCRGSWPDPDTVRPEPAAPAEPKIFCPKPHISPRRVDLVDPARDCLRNPLLCHILGAPGAAEQLAPYVRRVQSAEQLQAAIKLLRDQLNRRHDAADASPQAEAARSQIIDAMGGLVEEYHRFRRPNTAQIERTLKALFKQRWNTPGHTRALPEDVRNMLISGEFVWNEFENSSIEDWAACAVQYARAIEREFKRRLYDRCGESILKYQGKPMPAKRFTFGTVSYAYDNRAIGYGGKGDPNWQAFVIYAAQASGAAEADFEDVIGRLSGLVELRNKIAHSERIDASQAATIRSVALFDEATSEEGALVRFAELLDA